MYLSNIMSFVVSHETRNKLTKNVWWTFTWNQRFRASSTIYNMSCFGDLEIVFKFSCEIHQKWCRDSCIFCLETSIYCFWDNRWARSKMLWNEDLLNNYINKLHINQVTVRGFYHDSWTDANSSELDPNWTRHIEFRSFISFT